MIPIPESEQIALLKAEKEELNNLVNELKLRKARSSEERSREEDELRLANIKLQQDNTKLSTRLKEVETWLTITGKERRRFKDLAVTLHNKLIDIVNLTAKEYTELWDTLEKSKQELETP